jgi:hypothetical protein
MDLTEMDTKDLLARVEGNTSIANWSEERQNEFVQTFAQRSRVTRYLLILTAEIVWETAVRRHFISDKHYKAIVKDLVPDRKSYQRYNNFQDLHGVLYDKRDPYSSSATVGGRDIGALRMIAEQRAQQIINSLPPLAKAVNIIDPETAKKIDRKTKLQKEGDALREQLDEVCGAISLSEWADQNPKGTVREFLDMVETRNQERQKLIKRINIIALEGQRLESEVGKALFAGLPGLSEAVIDVIRNHIEQAVAFEATSRRVEEAVKFGNSEAAVSLLRHFEKDEVKVSDSVKAKFDEALEKLRLAKGRTKKAVKELR